MTGRLDTSKKFLDLSEAVNSVKHLMYAVESMADNFLQVASVDIKISDTKKNGYRPVLMTEEQFQALHFMIAHAGELARKADEGVNELEVWARNQLEVAA